MIKILKNIALLLAILLANGICAQDYVLRKQTYRNHRVCLSGGLGLSPLNLLVNKDFRPSITQQFNPLLSLEFAVTQTRTLSFVYKRNSFGFSQKPAPFLDHGQSITDYSILNANVYAQTLQVHLRKYSNFAGHIAPHGRYVTYFLSFNMGTVIESSSYSYSVKEQYSPSIKVVNVPESKTNVTNAGGLGFAVGKKIFMGKKLSRFLEIQLAYELNFLMVEDDIGFKDANGDNVWHTSRAKALLARNSVIQVSALYGFAF